MMTETYGKKVWKYLWKDSAFPLNDQNTVLENINICRILGIYASGGLFYRKKDAFGGLESVYLKKRYLLNGMKTLHHIK